MCSTFMQSLIFIYYYIYGVLENPNVKVFDKHKVLAD